MTSFFTNTLPPKLTRDQVLNLTMEREQLEATYMAAIMTGADGKPLYPQAVNKLVTLLNNVGRNDLAKDSNALGDFIHQRYQDIQDTSVLRDGSLTIGDMQDIHNQAVSIFPDTLKELGLPEELQHPDMFDLSAKQHEATLKANGTSIDFSAFATLEDTSRTPSQSITTAILTRAKDSTTSTTQWMREHKGANMAIGATTAAGAVGAAVAAKNAWKEGHKGKATLLGVTAAASAAVSATSWTQYVKSRGNTPGQGPQR